jgi:uncharacterized protein YjbI with pentapeptide repeats
MADPSQLDLIREGVEAWNQWRLENHAVRPDLHEADLRGANLIQANLTGANLSEADLHVANLYGANLYGAELRGADLRGANFCKADLHGARLSTVDLYSAYLDGANLFGANLFGAHLTRANLSGVYLLFANLTAADLAGANLRHAIVKGVNLTEADLTGADLKKANLTGAILVRTNLERATLTGALVYGASVWDANLTGCNQTSLVITPHNEPEITVDDLEVAQFIYLLLNNDRLRKVIDTVTSKVVLILGRFTSQRYAVLDTLREELRKRNYLPVLFDFPKSPNQTTDETIATLAGMARFVIADLTDAKSILQELRGIAPSRPMLAVQPILLAGQKEPGMFDFFRLFPWVLETQYYENAA